MFDLAEITNFIKTMAETLLVYQNFFLKHFLDPATYLQLMLMKTCDFT